MAERRTLPAWDPQQSDGCSALAAGPRALRRRVNDWFFRDFDAARAACQEHDRAYYYGGTPAQRKASDLVLADAWKAAGVPVIVRVAGYNAIRAFGRPQSRTEGVSWAFGDSFFAYSDEPASPE